MLTYPKIDPVLVQLGPLKVHWYGIMYLVGFAAAWGLGVLRSKREDSVLNKDQVGDFIFYGALGVVIGGRIGYMLFYNLPLFIDNPLTLFQIWDGGMSFHGGLLGVLVVSFLYAKKLKCSIFQITDFFAPMVPIGLGAGRIGNFINGELFGKVTTSPIGMIFPNGGPLPRYPSQLIECLLEGVVLFIVLWIYSGKPRPKMTVSALFLIGYAIARIIIEFFRQPDPQLGYLAFGWLTMGQVLSVPMLLVGVGMFWWGYSKMVKN